MNVPDEGYSKNVLFALSLISTFLLLSPTLVLIVCSSIVINTVIVTAGNVEP
jgi:hypothetical protein